MKALKLAILLLALLATPAFASSVTVDSIGDTWTLDYNGIIDVNGVPTVQPGLSARIKFTVVDIAYDASLNLTVMSLDIVVENTTDASLYQNATVSGIGFDTNPNVRRLGSSATGDYSYVALNTGLPTGAGFMVEVCVSGRYNRCSGPANNATMIGQIGAAAVTLGFSGNLIGQSIDFTNFGIRYSDIFSTQLGINGQWGIGVPVTPPIPEPASAAVFGLGVLMLAVTSHRLRK
jgi:hypothetical protein